MYILGLNVVICFLINHSFPHPPTFFFSWWFSWFSITSFDKAQRDGCEQFTTTFFSIWENIFLCDKVHLGNELMKPECVHCKWDLQYIFFTHTNTETSGYEMLISSSYIKSLYQCGFIWFLYKLRSMKEQIYTDPIFNIRFCNFAPLFRMDGNSILERNVNQERGPVLGNWHLLLMF